MKFMVIVIPVKWGIDWAFLSLGIKFRARGKVGHKG